MRIYKIAAACLLPLALSASAFAQSNQQSVEDSHHQAKLDERADKSQAKADKKARKALKSDKVKHAAKAQDKADRDAAKANSPQ